MSALGRVPRTCQVWATITNGRFASPVLLLAGVETGSRGGPGCKKGCKSGPKSGGGSQRGDGLQVEVNLCRVTQVGSGGEA